MISITLNCANSKRCTIDSAGVHIAGMDYKAVIIENGLVPKKEHLPYIEKIANSGRLIAFDKNAKKTFENVISANYEKALIPSTELDLVAPDVNVRPASKAIPLSPCR